MRLYQHLNPCDDNRGFTLIEVLIAVAIFSIGFLAVGLMQLNGLNATTASRRTTEAMEVATRQAEALMALPFYASAAYNFSPDLTDTGAEHINNAAWTGQYEVHWTVTDDQPLPPHAAGILTAAPLTRSKTIALWVVWEQDARRRHLVDLQLVRMSSDNRVARP